MSGRSGLAAALRRRPDALVLSVLGLFALTRVALQVLTSSGSWLLSPRRAEDVPGFVERWDRWDVGLFRKVARDGYAGYPERYPDEGIEAVFPGLPLLLRAVHVLVPDWTLAGMLVSLVAGGWAVVGLARLAEREGASGQRAVLYLLLSPWAVFLAAAYSEALFLALAVWGWLAAEQGRWARASVLVALACTVRVSGAFLAAALVVHVLVQERGRLRPATAWLLLPPLALAGYAAYLYALTGDPLRWFSAQEEGWERRLTLPWDALLRTLGYATDPGLRADYAWASTAEIGAVVVGLLGTALLLRERRWAQATYVGLYVGALATSSWYLSVSRATLLWFPLWLLLARGTARREGLHTAYLVVAVPLSAALAVGFTNGRWTG